MTKQHSLLRDGVQLRPLNAERTRPFAEVWMLLGNTQGVALARFVRQRTGFADNCTEKDMIERIRDRGFTLLELMVVISIIALPTGIWGHCTLWP